MEQTRQLKRISFRVITALVSVAGTLAALETAARVLTAPPADALFSDRDLRIEGRDFVRVDSRRGFALVPGYANRQFQVNSHGFRGEELPSDIENHFVVLAAGESTTFGWGVDHGDDYPTQLQEMLAAAGVTSRPVTVINAGVPSYSSSQTLLYLQEILPQRKPDLVLVSILWNDVWFATLSNWYPDVLVFQQPVGWRRVLLNHSALYRRLTIQPPPQGNPVDLPNDAALDQYQENIRQLIATCRRFDCPLAFVQPPFDGDHLPETGINPFGHVRFSKAFLVQTAEQFLARLAAEADRHNVPVIDHRLSLKDLHQKELFLDLLHPTPQGNALMARDVAAALQEHRLIR